MSLSGNNSGTGLATLVLTDGSTFHGHGIGAFGTAIGEICFNTAITGYQEIITDPSYAGQIITFTFPHIGNVGTNNSDIEALKPSARGLILCSDITHPSNWRSVQQLNNWLQKFNLVGISNVDTRRLTRHIRHYGAQEAALYHHSSKEVQLPSKHLRELARNSPGIDGVDLAKEVTCKQTYCWKEGVWDFSLNESSGGSYSKPKTSKYHVVAIDYGAKRNILRTLVSHDCKVTVVPATTEVKEILSHNPDGIFLSNGPGDPKATGIYAVPIISKLLETKLPIFGICLGHQMLALALGAQTKKMLYGHRGANHPVKNLKNNKVEITSQNHGFEVVAESLPDNVGATHISLFDGTLEGLEIKNRPVFSVQYHPEASPGPLDSEYLFERFVKFMDEMKSDA